MSDKYIIKNCPVCEFSDWEECTGYLAEGYICNDIHTEIVECQDRTDCKLKQIVDILRENTCKPEECGMNKPDWNGEVYGCNAGFDDNVSGCSCALANNLLRKLDIQEVE